MDSFSNEVMRVMTYIQQNTDTGTVFGLYVSAMFLLIVYIMIRGRPGP